MAQFNISDIIAAMAYDHRSLEKKYTQQWREQRLYEPDLRAAARPYYNLMMFPYPSAEGLHVGNMYAFTGADVHGRFYRMLGFDVFEPIGLDGFGIHSENYAIKVGRHPAQQAKVSEDNFYRQLGAIGNGFAWEERLETYDPEYYRWTQWLMMQMFKHGLAYKAEAAVNWCPFDKTVLADEQVEDGVCERCKNPVERRTMSSWFLRITDYADRLLDNIDNYAWQDAEGKTHRGLQWPGKVTTAQRNWIGRTTGLDIDFALENSPEKITVWTKFWETIFGVTYLVLAPEHPLASRIASQSQKTAVAEYIHSALNRSEQDRQAGQEKSGVFTGAYAVNPVNGERVPIWIADYVLTTVGTGAVMGVPAHDERDFAFAQKFGLPIIQVVAYADPQINQAVARGERSYEGEGVLLHSGQFDGQAAWGEGKTAIQNWLVNQNWARERVNYHLRDWLISRQRYWGPPIPLIYCEHCAEQGKGERPELPGWYAVPEADLPVLLPEISDFKPKGDGTSPLANAPDDWKSAACPVCGQPAKRELDVSDTFLDSAWYFLRYPWLGENDHPFGTVLPFENLKENRPGTILPEVAERQKRSQLSWFPVDAYIGGAEHAVLHLLYARFVTMALHDWGYLPSDEPFPFLFGHGLIIKDGAKMSKSRGNVVNPDEYIAKYGADALRAYLMFLGPYDQGGDFRDTGMSGMYKWLTRIWDQFSQISGEATDPDLKRKLHQVIAANTADLYQFKYNTCLARLMEVVNLWREGETMGRPEAIIFLQLLAPFAPFLTEALYQQIQDKNGTSVFHSIHSSIWPPANSALLEAETIPIAIQVNGKLRGVIEVNLQQATDQEFLTTKAKQHETVQRFLTAESKKVIVVPGKIINFVI